MVRLGEKVGMKGKNPDGGYGAVGYWGAKKEARLSGEAVGVGSLARMQEE